MRRTNQTLMFCIPVTAVLRATSMCLMLSIGQAGMAHASSIDRLVAAVNRVVVTEGDLSLARSLNAIISYTSSAAIGSRSEEIDRWIDRELMRQELNNFNMADIQESAVEARLQALGNGFAARGGLPALLQQTGLLESELVSYIRLELSILKFIDFRFRPFIQVSKEEIHAYYNERLIPQLRESKIELPEIDQVSTRIEAVLREEKVNAALDQWMKEIRRSARIEYFNDAQ